MWKVYFENHPMAGRYYHYARRQPGWIVKTALAVAAMVFLLPLTALLLLVIAAVILGVAVFLVLAILLSILTLPYRLFKALFLSKPMAPADEGRRNVVVIHPTNR
ncbi:MAG: hypothetical protein HC898_02740 [Phycisphaerales bacterium]|nr:hypothetical protein [Phycisphaerales bacterium]